MIKKWYVHCFVNGSGEWQPESAFREFVEFSPFSWRWKNPDDKDNVSAAIASGVNFGDWSFL